MRDSRVWPRPEDVTVAALFALPFAIYLVVLRVVAPPTEAHWAAADPILTILPRTPTLWIPPVAAVALAAAWWRLARPDRRALRRGLAGALLGALAALAACVTLRLVHGEVMPSFVPPEESVAPGFLLSMTAGFEEELVCRLALMPAIYFGLRGRLSARPRAVIALLVTALVFALWHALGEGTVMSPYFITRFVIPGCVMGVVWFVSPSAVVVGHATAHVAMPALFVAAA